VQQTVMSRPGFNERLAIDVARLKLETGPCARRRSISTCAACADRGLPREAVKVIDKGYAAGVLGSGGEAERHRRLKDLAAKNLAEDKKTIAPTRSKARSRMARRSSTRLQLRAARTHREGAQHDAAGHKGTRLHASRSRQAAARLRVPLAGQGAKALEMFKTVQGSDGAAALARLWVIRLSRTT